MNTLKPYSLLKLPTKFIYKKAKQEFLEELGQLQTQISRMMTDIVSIHKDLNKKSTYMIKDISEDLEQVMEKVLGNGM